MNRRPIFLTGATGFLGNALLKRLLDSGESVYVLSRSPLPEQAGCTQVRGDITQDAWVDRIPWTEIGTVFHLAAAGVKASRRSWAETLEVNVVGTQRLLNILISRAAQAPQLIATGTFYEDSLATNLALRENPYISTKAAAAKLVLNWSKIYKGPVRLAKVFQCYGPGDDPGSVLSYAARNLMAGTSATFGSGLGQRDWIHLNDAVSALVACSFDNSGGVARYDIGTGELHSLREAIETLKDLSASTSELTFDPAKDRPDVGIALKARSLPPAWQPSMTFTQGLKTLILS
jgi:nucleoside-diphosphate-sugar epimerase